VTDTDTAAVTALPMEKALLDEIKGLSPLVLSKVGKGSNPVNVADVDVSVDVGEEMTEVAGRLVGALDVNMLGVEEAPKARAESVAESVQVPVAVTVTMTVTSPSAPVNVEEPTDADAEMAAAVAKGGSVLWTGGVDDTAVEVLSTALVGVGSTIGEMAGDELVMLLDAVLTACDVRMIKVGELVVWENVAADSSPAGVTADDVLVKLLGSIPLSFTIAAVPVPLGMLLFPDANDPLADDVVVLFESSCPVIETPVACILASASAWESHTIDVPTLFTRGRAKQEVPAGHALVCH
jgi:hypothetical protein